MSSVFKTQPMPFNKYFDTMSSFQALFYKKAP